jgi:outer membrane receptor protein involved in Fe transport
VGGATTLTVGVNNLFNAAPPTIYNGNQDNTDPTAYDVTGRFVYGRITHRL